MVPIVLFVGRSDTGKTTLVEGVIRCLKSMGYCVGALKRASHEVEMDHEGTDSWRFARAGADITLLASPDGVMVSRKCEEEMSLEMIAAQYARDVDILLVEGYKGAGLPKIEVHRSEVDLRLLCRGPEQDQALAAVASDLPLDLDVPVFHIDDHASIGRFIVERFMKS